MGSSDLSDEVWELRNDESNRRLSKSGIDIEWNEIASWD